MALFRETRGGTEAPFRVSNSRLLNVGESTVTTNASKPASRARAHAHQRGLSVAPHIELKPLGTAAFGKHGFHRRVRCAGQGEGDASIGRGACQRGFTAVPHPASDTGRRDQQWKRVALAEQAGASIAVGNVV